MSSAGTAGQPLLPIASARQTRAALVGLLRPHRGLATLTLLIQVAETGPGLFAATLLGRIVDVVVARADPAEIILPATLIAVSTVTGGLLTALGAGLLARLGEGMLATLRERFVQSASGCRWNRSRRRGPAT